MRVSVEVRGGYATGFNYWYYKGLAVEKIEPSNVYVPTSQTNPYRVKVNGQNFLPLRSYVKCFLTNENTMATSMVQGNYVNNHTIECEIPPPG